MFFDRWRARRELRKFQAFLGGQLGERSWDQWEEWKLMARRVDLEYRRRCGRLDKSESCEFFVLLMLKDLSKQGWRSMDGHTERERARVPSAW